MLKLLSNIFKFVVGMLNMKHHSRSPFGLNCGVAYLIDEDQDE